MINKICKRCDKSFKVHKYRASRARFCSKKCYWGEKITLECKNCNKLFKKFPSVLKYKYGKYCSQKCRRIFQRGKDIICKICGKSFYVQKYRLKDNPRFCSAKCKGIASRKKNKPGSGGYKLVYMPNHPQANGSGDIQEHILVAEEFLGRYLTPEESIHHINHKTSDNRIENLYLFPTFGEHMSYHNNVRYGNCKKIVKSNLIKC